MFVERLTLFWTTGFTTITSTAVLFGKTTLHMQPSSLILVGVLAPTSGIIGSLVWPSLQRMCKWSNLKVLIILVVMASLMPAYGCLGFLPALRGEGRFGGLTTKGELFALAIYFGGWLLWHRWWQERFNEKIGPSRLCVRRVPKLCKGILCGVAASRRRSEMASLYLLQRVHILTTCATGMPVFYHHRQSAFPFPSEFQLLASFSTVITSSLAPS